MFAEGKIVVTGYGLVSPLGHTSEETWNNMLTGQSGVVEYDTGHPKIHAAAPVKNFDPLNHFDTKKLKKMPRSTQLAIVAGREALNQAGILYDGTTHLSPSAREKTGIQEGTGYGGSDSVVDTLLTMQEKGIERISPFDATRTLPDNAIGAASIEFGFQGPGDASIAACASGNAAVINAALKIKGGTADRMLVLATDSIMRPVIFGGFATMTALAPGRAVIDGEEFIYTPEETSRPFDKGANGFVMGEGAGAIFMETEESAIARGALIYARIGGLGQTLDASHITTPSGNGAERAMKQALDSAHIKPEDIDFVQTHGTGTPAGDPIEIAAYLNVFGEHAYKKIYEATKSQHGHQLGEAALLALIISIIAMHRNKIPPTRNLTKPIKDVTNDEEIPGMFFPSTAVERRINNVMGSGFGFGGNNATVILFPG